MNIQKRYEKIEDVTIGDLVTLEGSEGVAKVIAIYDKSTGQYKTDIRVQHLNGAYKSYSLLKDVKRFPNIRSRTALYEFIGDQKVIDLIRTLRDNGDIEINLPPHN